MSASTPFEQLTGALQVYIAPYGETVPDVNILPSGNWVLLGATDGDQKLKHGGKVNMWSDNDHQGNVKVNRTDEEITVALKLVSLTLENYAYTISQIGNMTSGTTVTVPTVAYKRLPLKRGAVVYEYAMLLRGGALSPYGILPGMYVLPRIIQQSEPNPTFGKNQRAELETEWYVLEDDAQPDGDKMGWLVVQAS